MTATRAAARRVACRRDERVAFGGLERSGWVVDLDELA